MNMAPPKAPGHPPEHPPERSAEGRAAASRVSRPLFWAAALAAVGAGELLVRATGADAREIGSGFVTYLVLAAAVEGSCAVGLRLRKRWGFAAYLSFFPLNQLILAAVASWSPVGFLLRLAAVVLAALRLSELE